MLEVPGVRQIRGGDNCLSMSVSPDGRSLATLDYFAQTGYLAVIDVASGKQRPLCQVQHVSGGEHVTFSPDGRWILIPRTFVDVGPTIVAVDSGCSVCLHHLAGHSSCWWVNEGHLGLLSFGSGDFRTAGYDPLRILFFDLTTLETTDFLRAQVPDSPILPLSRQGISNPEPRSDGTVLIGTFFGPPSEYQENNGSRSRVSILDLSTGQIQLLFPAFVDAEETVERSHSLWSWNSPLDARITSEVCADLLHDALPPNTDTWPDFADECSYILQVSFDSPFITGEW